MPVMSYFYKPLNFLLKCNAITVVTITKHFSLCVLFDLSVAFDHVDRSFHSSVAPCDIVHIA